MLQSLGFDPWLWCRSAQCSLGERSGEVFSSPWFRLTPVLLAQDKMRSLQAAAAVELFGVTCSSHIPATSSSPPVPRCPLGRETGAKFSGSTVKKLSVPSLLEDWDSLMAFYSLHSFCRKSFFKLRCSFGWEQGFCLAETFWQNLLCCT